MCTRSPGRGGREGRGKGREGRGKGREERGGAGEGEGRGGREVRRYVYVGSDITYVRTKYAPVVSYMY